MRYFLPFPHNGCPSFYSKQKYRFLFSLQPWKHLTFVFFNTIIFNRHRFLYDFSLHFLMTDDPELFFSCTCWEFQRFCLRTEHWSNLSIFLKVLAISLLWSCLNSPCILNINLSMNYFFMANCFLCPKEAKFKFCETSSVFPLVFYT